MRKTTKGAIAVGAGVALLLGGAGTMAYWTQSSTFGSTTTISSGNLAIAPKTGATGSPVWTWKTSGATFAPATSKIVPGDTVVVTQTFTVTAQGDNLKATVALAVPGLTNNVPAAATNPLLNELTVTPTVATSGTQTGTGTVTTAGNVVSVTANSGTTTFDVTVKVEVAFPFGVADSARKGSAQSVDLSTSAITVTQI
ncbi:alternate-type signal peptide domain-containing protein [Cellulomonas sp. P5_C6]